MFLFSTIWLLFLNVSPWLRSKPIAIFPTVTWCWTGHVFLKQRSRLVVVQAGRVWKTDYVLLGLSENWLEERVQIRHGIHPTALSTAEKVRTALIRFFLLTFGRCYGNANGDLFGTQTNTLVKTRRILETMAPRYGVVMSGLSAGCVAIEQVLEFPNLAVLVAPGLPL